MGKINIGRLILGGLVAGIVGDLLGFLVDGVLLQQGWADAMLALDKQSFGNNQIIEFNVLGLILGMASVWVYVGFRPRFGACWKAAVIAGITVWVIGVLIPNASFMYVTELFPKHLTLYTTLGGLLEIVAGTVAGAALYKE